ncbi:MAG: hypothetical protein IT162_09350 [Bryobacterales bacterium]|nr:hypothetical protein [Bryobacterales bacterium]
MLTRRAFGGAAFAGANVAAAQESKAARGKRVLDEALTALGGPKFSAMRDRTESGRAYSFYRDRLTGLARATIYTRYVMRPEPPTAEPNVFQRERQSFGKDKEVFAYLFDETKGWEISFRGARPFPAERIERYRDSTRRNIFYILRQRLGEPGLIVESAGSQVFENQPVELVDIVDGDNNTVTVYFHRSTKLPIRQVYFRRDPIARERHEEVTIFGKYRDSGGGVMWPWAMTRTRDGDKVFEIFSDSVKINTALDDSLFTLPANVRMLPEAK